MNEITLSIIIIGLAVYTATIWSVAYIKGHKKGLDDAMKINKELGLIK